MKIYTAAMMMGFDAISPPVFLTFKLNRSVSFNSGARETLEAVETFLGGHHQLIRVKIRGHYHVIWEGRQLLLFQLDEQCRHTYT